MKKVSFIIPSHNSQDYIGTTITELCNDINTYSKNVEFGVWYIRIRDKKDTLTPFDGVVKVEKILMDDEYDYGIDSDTIDLISANIINERAPTCSGKDSRWANHLYPVFVTESYVKSNYMSNEMFMHLF